MALNDIANASCIVSATLGAVATPVPIPSLKSKVGGVPVLTDVLNVVLAGGVSGSCVGVAGTGTIEKTATKVKADGKFVLRKGDTGTGTINGTDPSASGAPCSFDVDLEIVNAGQDKVVAE